MKYLLFFLLVGCVGKNSAQPTFVVPSPKPAYNYPEDNFDKAASIFYPHSKWVFDKDFQAWRKVNE